MVRKVESPHSKRAPGESVNVEFLFFSYYKRSEFCFARSFLRECNERFLARCDFFFSSSPFHWLHTVFTSPCITWITDVNLKCILAVRGKAGRPSSPSHASSTAMASSIFQKPNGIRHN